MIDSRAIVGPALIYAVTSATSAAVPLLILPIMTRVLSPEEYGMVAMFAVVVSILAALTGLSIHGAVGVRYFERAQYDLPQYISTCMLILVGSAGATAVLVYAGSSWLETVTKIPKAWLMIGVLVASAQFVVQMRLVVWQCASQAWRYGALRIAQAVVDAAASLIMVLALGLAWEGRTGGYALAAAIAGAVALLSLRYGGWLPWRAKPGYALDALKFGVPLIPHVVGGLLLALVDRFVISNVLDVGSTGIYVVAVQVGMVLGLVVDSFNKAFAPWLTKNLSRADRTGDSAMVRFTYVCFAAVILIAIMFGLAAPWLLPALVGENFRAAGPIIIYIALGHAFTGMYYMVATYIFVAGRTSSLAGMTLTAGLFNVPASYLLVVHNGVIGAAQAFMLAQAFLFIGTWYLAQRAHPMPWRTALAPVSSRSEP